jgi:hypothetical protein
MEAVQAAWCVCTRHSNVFSVNRKTRHLPMVPGDRIIVKAKGRCFCNRTRNDDLTISPAGRQPTFYVCVRAQATMYSLSYDRSRGTNVNLHVCFV